ncbi:MAG: hypothetical protein HS111_14455 [Kofleriaceae bacterium]|nr:hypothetical protein [Kofleriaceae bacterium]
MTQTERHPKNDDTTDTEPYADADTVGGPTIAGAITLLGTDGGAQVATDAVAAVTDAVVESVADAAATDAGRACARCARGAADDEDGVDDIDDDE